MKVFKRISRDMILTVILVATLTTSSVAAIVSVRSDQQHERESERRGSLTVNFIQNFSDYMSCLIVPDEVKYKELGRAAYVEECSKILFR